MDDLDLELKSKAREALQKMNGDPDQAANLLFRWIQGGYVGAGLAERALRDYVSAIVLEEARPIDA